MGKAERLARQKRKIKGRQDRAFEREMGMTRDEYNTQLLEEAKARYGGFRRHIAIIDEAKQKLTEVVLKREELETEHPDNEIRKTLEKEVEKYRSWEKEQKELSAEVRSMNKNPRVLTSNSFGYEYERVSSKLLDGPWRKERNCLPETLTTLAELRKKIRSDVDKNEVISRLFERLRELKVLMGSTPLFLKGIGKVPEIEKVWEEV